MPALPSWLTEPLRDQFATLLPERPKYHPDHPLRCHRPRISDRIIFDKLLQLLRLGCSYGAIADTTCSATTIRHRRDEWIRLGVFARLKQIALESYARIIGLVLDQIAVDRSITKAPGGGEAAGRSPVVRGKQGLKRSGMTDGYGIPLGRVLADANRHDSPLCSHRPCTACTTSARYPTTSPCIWTPATTPRGPALSSTNAASTEASRARARRHPSRPVSVGTSNAPRLTECFSPPRPLLRAAHDRPRRILRPRQHDHHRA